LRKDVFSRFLLVLSSFAFSAIVSAFQRFTRKYCLQISALTMRDVTWNRFLSTKCADWFLIYLSCGE